VSLRPCTFAALWRLKPVLEHVPLIRRVYDGWARRHPFDLLHGIDTSGTSPAMDNAPNAAMAALMCLYAGSQPSIVRAGLAALPEPDHYAFVDIGCGKGRPLVVASEFPFRKLIGVEISSRLADVARANAAVIARRYPSRTAIEVQIGDATRVLPPTDNVVYFMYHPFGRPLVGALVETIASQLGHALRHAFIVYYNPVHGDVLDASPSFARWRADMLPYASGELGFGPDLSDAVVIWQSVPGRYQACPRADRRICVPVAGGAFARLEDD
jgi:SAM-dependent methyltransferase